MKKIFGIFLMATAFFLVSCGGGSKPSGQEQDEDMVLEKNEVVAPAPTTPPATTLTPEQIKADSLKQVELDRRREDGSRQRGEQLEQEAERREDGRRQRGEEAVKEEERREDGRRQRGN